LPTAAVATCFEKLKICIKPEVCLYRGETMFEQAMLSNANGGRRAWTTGLGFAGQASLVGFVALVPMIWPEAMPKPQALLTLLSPPAPVAPPPTTTVRPRVVNTVFERPLFTMPRTIPTTIARVVDDPPEVVGALPGVGHPTGDPNGLLTAILNGHGTTPAPPVAAKKADTPTTAPPSEPQRIRTSSIELARILRRVEPVYPPVAKLAHVSGTVELTGVIATDCHIRELKALSGNPLLIKAALDAVSQWIYAPPVLNGERVEVIAPITVNFRLDR
jgi:periplasmic protein TonB